MDPVIDELKEHAKKGNELLGKLPLKSQYLQQEKNIVQKYSAATLKDPFQKVNSQAEQQIKFLRNEYERQKNEASENFNRWHSQVIESLSTHEEVEAASKLNEAKKVLELRDKISSSIKIIEGVMNSIGNNKKQHDDVQIKKASAMDMKKDAWMKLINSGESDIVEFKSSLRWDFKGNNLNKHLEIPVIKTIAAFLNSDGGTLFIGIDDEKNVIGIEADYPTLKRQDGDGFIQYLLQITNHAIGKEFNKFISMNVSEIESKEICVIEVQNSNKPVFLKHNNKEEFYIRASLSSQPLNVREAIEYVNMHFKDQMT